MTFALNQSEGAQRLYWGLHKDLADSLIVGFGGGQPGYLACLWASWAQSKSLVLFRGNDFEKNIHDAKRAASIHFILDRADAIACVSKEMAQRVSTLRELPTYFTPNGIDLSQWSWLPKDRHDANTWRRENCPEGKAIVGMVGQLKAKKGLDMAVALFTSFGLHERACLLTVGDIPEAQRPLLERLGEAIWLSVPFTESDHLPAYYAAMDIVFLPSYYDGMPNVLLEAMALGCIVVASKAGGIPDVVNHGDNGFLFEIGDYVDAAKALDSALSLSDEARELMSQRARQLIKESYAPAREINVIQEILTQTVK